MDRGQGRPFSQEKILKIRYLLAETDMTVSEIATRMQCTPGPILSINRRFGIRRYNTRTKWELLGGLQVHGQVQMHE